MLGALGEGRADQLDDRLVTLGVLPLVYRKGDIARPDQVRHRRAVTPAGAARHRRLQPLCIVLRIAAHRALGRDVGDDQAHWPVALCL